MTTLPTVKSLRWLTGEAYQQDHSIARRIRRTMEKARAEGRTPDDILAAAEGAIGRNLSRLTHGIEALSPSTPSILIINTGETYTTTLLYDRRTDRIYVTSWGGYAESREIAGDPRFRRRD